MIAVSQEEPLPSRWQRWGLILDSEGSQLKGENRCTKFAPRSAQHERFTT